MSGEPELVSFKPFGLADLPFRVLEHAYWRPQAAKLAGKHAIPKSVVVHRKEDFRISRTRAAWVREEIWINHAFEALLSSLPTGVRGAWMASLASGFQITGSQPASLDYRGIRGVTGDPDFILIGNGAIVLGECKVGRHKANGRYSLDQYGKYMRLAALCRCSAEARLPGKVVHVVLVPNARPQEFVGDYEEWQPEVIDHQLRLSPGKYQVRTSSGDRLDYAAWRLQMATALRSRRVQRSCPQDLHRLETLLAADAEPFAATYVWSWGDAIAQLEALCTTAGLDSLSAAARAIGHMASGKGIVR